MSRWKITLEYDGGPFIGWQRQETGLSVQQVLEEAAEKLAGEAVLVQGAGRTDAGVHALGQVAHMDIAKPRSAKDIRDGMNFHLKPHPVSVLAAHEVDDAFHARTSAIERQYIFRILNRRSPPALDAGRVWYVPYALDAAAMHTAAQMLVGAHDFTSFRAAECQARSPLKTLDELTVTRRGDEIEIFTRARSFLHHQVRNMVGTLALVGSGKWTAKDVKSALDARDRSAGGPTCPPDGLYLLKVLY